MGDRSAGSRRAAARGPGGGAAARIGSPLNAAGRWIERARALRLGDAARLPLRAASLLLLVTAGLGAAASLSWPLGFDQGVFAWVGDTILRGGAPYRDALDVKGPVTYLPFVAVEAVFGAQAWAIRVFDLLALGATLIVLWRTVARLSNRSAAWFGAALAGVCYWNSGFWDTVQPDGWAAMLVAVVACASLTSTARAATRPRAFLLGGLLAAAALLKSWYAVFALVPLSAVLTDGDLTGRDKRQLIVMGCLGFILSGLALVAWLAPRHALGDFVATYFGLDARNAAAGAPSIQSNARAFVTFYLHRTRTTLLTVAAAGGVGWIMTGARRNALPVALWLVLSLLGAAVMGRWEGYDMHAAHFALAFLSALGLSRLAEPSPPAHPSLAFAVLVALTLASAEPVLRDGATWVKWRTGRLATADYQARYNDVWLGFSFYSSERVAHYLRAHSRSDDRVLAVENPLINYLAGRAGIGRYVSPVPAWDTFVADAAARRGRFMADFAAARPKYVVLGPPAVTRASTATDPPSGRALIPELMSVIERAYRLEVACDRHYVYVRRSEAVERPPAAAGADTPLRRSCNEL